MSEKWRPVPGWEGIYEISDQGRYGQVSLHPVNEVSLKGDAA